jgi:hypothetical protein
MKKGGKERVGDLMHWDQLVWYQCKVASGEHASREVTHEWSCLEMQITEHFVGSPSAKEADDVGVDVGA